MGKFDNSAEALVEILTLCEQTLTALGADYDNCLSARQTDQNGREARRCSTKIVRQLFLIEGGLSRKDRQFSARRTG
jgi:hypothetical protein